jgi:alpha-1,2-mannosyltransferase
MKDSKPGIARSVPGMSDRFRLSAKWQIVILIACGIGILIHFWITVSRVGSKIGDYDVNREFGRRFLVHEELYEGGQCFNYMPVSALYWAPLALVSPRVGMAGRCLTAIICLGLTFRMLFSMAFPDRRVDWTKATALTLLSIILALHYLLRDFDDGGPHVILLAILVGGVYCIWRGRGKLAAFWLGLGIATKITPGLFLPYLLWKRQWRIAAYTGAATVLWILLPALWMGSASWWRHQQQWNQVALSVFQESQEPGREDNEQRVQNQALKPAIMRYLITYPSGHSMRLDQAGYLDFLNWSPAKASRVADMASLMIAIVFCWRTRKRWDESEPKSILGEISGLLLLVLLFSPVSWLQHFVFAMPAIFWIVTQPSRTLTRWVLGVYVILALVINRELVGRENYLLLLSYHTHTVCLLLLFTLVMVGSSRRAGSGIPVDQAYGSLACHAQNFPAWTSAQVTAVDHEVHN